NSLKGMLAEDAFEKTGIDPMGRPETLSMADFVALSDLVVA
nr:16S rRNA (adenine(1518)-N(6)/adenine(1519)-N(6))-dimethyltransferase [Acinetobacter sp.]